VRRTRLLALITLAMINVCTLVAGIAVARMLPGRLAALRIPYVAGGPTATVSPVLPPGTAERPLPSHAGLVAALSGPLGAAPLGSHVLAVVTDPLTGQVLLSHGAYDPAEPASTAKIATAAAAIDVLGAVRRFTTRVVQASPGQVVLVGGGDPMLSVGPYPAGEYPRPATLTALAASTARALRTQRRASVSVGFDTSLYGGPGFAPGWPEAYVTTGNTTQIVSLEVDQGRLTSAGEPDDADDPWNFTARAAYPAQMAADAFAALLARDGISVTGTPAPQVAPPGAQPLASVSSPTVGAMTEVMLAESNNVIAENLARHVALASGYPATFAGAAAAVTAVVRGLGVTAPFTMVDGSGLSPLDQIAPASLARLLQAVVARPRLHTVLTGLPVAGFSGTLVPGGSVFGRISGAALGVVRAKTGNLDTVAGLAGLVYDKDGRLLAFAIMADRVTALNAAASAITTAAANLAALLTPPADRSATA